MATTALNQNAVQKLLQARNARASGNMSVDKSIQQALARYVDASPWIQYDRQFFQAAAVPLGSIITLATYPNSGQLPFFNVRTLANSSEAFTNATDVNKFDTDFECHCISIDVYMVGDATSAAGTANAEAFAEEIVQNGAFVLKFGVDPKYMVPVSKLPAGGGVFTTTKIRTQAAAGDTDSATSTNGVPHIDARRVLEEPIFFEKQEQFSCYIQLNAASTARVQALTALTGNNQAMIGVSFEGVRGKPFLRGSKK